MTFNMDAYREWRQAHPAQPLHRDVEESLIIEVAMLRDEVAMLQQEARIRKNLCDGLAEEADAERAAVVAWLRTQRLYCTDSTGTPNAVSATYAHAAEAIEDGEHRREEEPARAGGFGVRLATVDELVEMGLLERPVKEER